MSSQILWMNVQKFYLLSFRHPWMKLDLSSPRGIKGRNILYWNFRNVCVHIMCDSTNRGSADKKVNCRKFIQICYDGSLFQSNPQGTSQICTTHDVVSGWMFKIPTKPVYSFFDWMTAIECNKCKYNEEVSKWSSVYI